jgi:hypothetical protein
MPVNSAFCPARALSFQQTSLRQSFRMPRCGYHSTFRFSRRARPNHARDHDRREMTKQRWLIRSPLSPRKAWQLFNMTDVFFNILGVEPKIGHRPWLTWSSSCLNDISPLNYRYFNCINQGRLSRTKQTRKSNDGTTIAILHLAKHTENDDMKPYTLGKHPQKALWFFARLTHLFRFWYIAHRHTWNSDICRNRSHSHTCQGADAPH